MTPQTRGWQLTQLRCEGLASCFCSTKFACLPRHPHAKEGHRINVPSWGNRKQIPIRNLPG